MSDTYENAVSLDLETGNDYLLDERNTTSPASDWSPLTDSLAVSLDLEAGNDYLSDERNTTSPASDWSPLQRNVFSHKNDLNKTTPPRSDWCPLQRNIFSHESNLIKTQSPGSDCPNSASGKHYLNPIQSSKNNYSNLLKRIKTDAEASTSNSDAGNCRMSEKLRKCEPMLRKIIRTAYQFTRHSRREKLTVKDLEKAFKILGIDMEPDDSSYIDKNDMDSVESDCKSQPFTCSGMWLR